MTAQSAHVTIRPISGFAILDVVWMERARQFRLDSSVAEWLCRRHQHEGSEVWPTHPFLSSYQLSHPKRKYCNLSFAGGRHVFFSDTGALLILLQVRSNPSRVQPPQGGVYVWIRCVRSHQRLLFAFCPMQCVRRGLGTCSLPCLLSQAIGTRPRTRILHCVKRNCQDRLLTGQGGSYGKVGIILAEAWDDQDP
ncbi:hypothetical protein N658DRAFT_305595 [Parathielavia hyrcaniae]|uniref:Uncharacterized protein n=1 Tax=Parathielavia hyrcaniae TaxID=113614 RepID=A0AAN6T3Y8_9PEZI|nr:hypothetical protein N658DRAFT_305595 [Parathielavia hyrcaniae]